MTGAVDILRVCLDLGLVDAGDEYTVHESPAGLPALGGGARWHLYPDDDCLAGELTERTFTAGHILDVLTTSGPALWSHQRASLGGDGTLQPDVSDLRFVCHESHDYEWVTLTPADDAVLSWISSARAAGTGDGPSFVHALSSYRSVDGAFNAVPCESTHPVLSTEARRLRDELAARIPFMLAAEHRLPFLLQALDQHAGENHRPAHVSDPDWDALVARAPYGAQDAAAQQWAEQMWQVMGRHRVWVHAAYSDCPVVYAYAPAADLALVPALTTADPFRVWCLDAGYTEEEVSAAHSVIEMTVPALAERSTRVENFIDAYRAARI